MVDLNRPSDNQPMYAGANNTELCPTRFFTGEPLYRDGMAPTTPRWRSVSPPTGSPTTTRCATSWRGCKAEHGHAMLFDGHSIKSELPWLFDGRLPDLNLGTASGAACAPSLRDALAALLRAQTQFSVAVDGRFKGGHITRHYGQPREGVHAVQLEKCWSTYMRETPPLRLGRRARRAACSRCCSRWCRRCSTGARHERRTAARRR